MAEYLPQTIDAGRLHLEVGDPVGAVGESGEAIDELGLAKPEPQDPSLGAVEARAGDGNPLMEAGSKVAEEGRAGAAEIGPGEPVVGRWS